MNGDGAPRLCGVEVPDAPEAWARAGFTVVDGRIALDGLEVVAAGPDRLPALRFDRAHPRGVDHLDGVPWRIAESPAAARGAHADGAGAAAPLHPNGIDRLDHVVIMASNLDDVRRAVAAAGLSTRRERATAIAGRAVTQLFVPVGPTILEIVAPSDPSETTDDTPRGSLIWGLAMSTPDLDATVNRLGDAVGRPRDAVQEGRRIATVRHEMLGLATTLAVMSPRSPR